MSDMDVSIAVMQEQLRSIAAGMNEAREARKAQYLQSEKQSETLMKIEHRLEKVETFVAGASPTLAEFNALKLKAQGAGTLGRWLWILAGASIGAVATVAGYFQKLWGH